MKTFQNLDEFLLEIKDLPPNLLFQTTNEPHTQDFDCKGFIQIDSLMRILQVVAQKDLHSNGYDVANDILNGHQWMVRHYNISIERFPNPCEKIKIYSWVSEIEKIQATKNFLIVQDEQIICKATSQWFIVNMKAEKFEPMPETYRNNIWEMKLFDNKIKKFSIPLSGFWRQERVGYHLIDNNKHMNNSYYSLLATEAVEDEFRLKHVPYSFDIYFKKEVKFGETVCTYTNFANDTETLHSLRNEKGEELSQIKIKWKEI